MVNNLEDLKEILKNIQFNTEESIETIAKNIGYSRAYMNDAINKGGNEKLKAKLLGYYEKSKQNVPHKTDKSEVNQVPNTDYMEVEYLPIHAQAGYLNDLTLSIIKEPNLPTMLVPKEFEKGRYLVIEVNGDSMDDGTTKAICEGDKLLVKELDNSFWKSKLNFSRYLFVIAHKDGVVVKQVVKHNVDKGIITCHSWNTMFEDFELKLNGVYQLFYVKKIVERKIRF